MNMSYVLLGLAAGSLSGLLGLGGAVIIVPALVYIFGLTQLQAQGTAIAALVPPIGLLAALRYYQSGNVKMGIAGLICLGFFVGGFLGASLAQVLPEPIVKKSFGILLLVISVHMIFFK